MVRAIWPIRVRDPHTSIFLGVLNFTNLLGEWPYGCKRVAFCFAELDCDLFG